MFHRNPYSIPAVNEAYKQAVESVRREAADNVNKPPHYTAGQIECIDAIREQMPREAFIGFLQGNVVKYLWRWRHKGGIESLQKGQWYYTKLLEELNKENQNAD